ncbi:MAG: hypothetical protein U0232_18535 [Thermomicrobiales bacterium]
MAGALGTGVPDEGALLDGAVPPVLPVGVVLGVPQAARRSASRSGAASK